MTSKISNNNNIAIMIVAYVCLFPNSPLNPLIWMKHRVINICVAFGELSPYTLYILWVAAVVALKTNVNITCMFPCILFVLFIYFMCSRWVENKRQHYCTLLLKAEQDLGCMWCCLLGRFLLVVNWVSKMLQCHWASFSDRSCVIWTSNAVTL